MTVYIDLVFLLNLFYDILILMTVSITLKRNIKFSKILLGGLIGSLSLAILFLKVDNIILFILKILTSIIMCLVTFKYKDIKYTCLNLLYLYMTSIILAGFLYFLDLEFSYKHEGLVFYFNGLSINYIILVIFAPIILYIYIWQNRKLKQKQNLYYNVKIVLKNNKHYDVTGYLDTGNRLKDPITKKEIIIIEKNIINKINIRSPIYVPYKTVNYKGLLICFSPKYILIDNKKFNNFLLGIYDGKLRIEGANCILNYKLMEDLNV